MLAGLGARADNLAMNGRLSHTEVGALVVQSSSDLAQS